MEEAKKMKCYKRLIYKQFVQVSGLFGPQFLSYLPKRFTLLCRDLYGDRTLVHRFINIDEKIVSVPGFIDRPVAQIGHLSMTDV